MRGFFREVAIELQTAVMEEVVPVCDRFLLQIGFHNTQLMITLVTVLIRNAPDSAKYVGKLKLRHLGFAENQILELACTHTQDHPLMIHDYINGGFLGCPVCSPSGTVTSQPYQHAS